MKRNRSLWVMLSVFSSFLILSACDPTSETQNLPVLTTMGLSAISQTTAICGGIISSDGGDTITAKGVCWSTSQTPTIADSKAEGMEMELGMSSFFSFITGLQANTTYYVRAYATTSKGTGYGNAVPFKTLEASAAVIDVDGNVYTTVTIGSQTWLGENLKTTKYRNGDLIGTTTLNVYTEITPKYQWTYGNAATYGLLYSWYAIMDSRNICPVGWHIPSNDEWDVLKAEVMYSASDLKETGNAHWVTHPGSNTSGFTALPNGYRNDAGNNYLLGTGAYWWTSTDAPAAGAALIVLMNNTDNSFYTMGCYKCSGLGVRCIKD